MKQVSSQAQSSALSSYTYTIGLAGNRLTVAELNGRSVAYGYDSLYRLTSESASYDPNAKNGTVSYTYDSVGNRKTLNSTLPPAGGITYSYDADHRLGSEQYDANRNVLASMGSSNNYDFENHFTGQSHIRKPWFRATNLNILALAFVALQRHTRKAANRIRDVRIG